MCLINVCVLLTDCGYPILRLFVMFGVVSSCCFDCGNCIGLRVFVVIDMMSCLGLL